MFLFKVLCRAAAQKNNGYGKLFALFFGHFTLGLFISGIRYDTLIVERTDDADADGQEGL